MGRRLRRVHLHEDRHVVMGVEQGVRAVCLVLRVDVVPVPLHDIVLVLLTELMQGVDLILDDLLSRALLEVIGPRSSDVDGFGVWPLEEAVLDCIRLGDCIVNSETREADQANQHVDPGYDDLALA